jgi:2-polyprenyl-3-methyl-5-hydroxy-6-metoxy-1,4-benzoquinol methylase
MSRQNVYDDPEFFAGYQRLRDAAAGLHERVLEPHLDALLPELAEKRVIDVGCGDGWLCRIAREHGARAVQGIDPSSRMLQRARELTADPCVTYTRGFVEDVDVTAGSDAADHPQARPGILARDDGVVDDHQQCSQGRKP